MTINIKKATLKDLPNIQELSLKLFQKEHAEYDSALNLNWTFSGLGKKYFKNKITGQNSCALLVVANHKIIGYLCGSVSKADPCRGPLATAELENIFILPEYRSLGIGSQLYNEFNKWCKHKKIQMIKVHAYTKNKKAIKFYENNGFNNLGSILEAHI